MISKVFSRAALANLVLAMLLVASAAQASPGTDHLKAIERTELDPSRCYRVRDLFLEREDVKLYFTDGHLIFAKPLGSRTLSALFLATEPSDFGEVLLVPPDPGERQSMARFLDETILNEKFRSALMFFTDDTADKLLAKVGDQEPDAETGERLAKRWTSVLRNLIDGSALRVFVDTFSDQPLERGFFAAAIRGNQLSRFDVIVDPRAPRQVAAGQLVRADGRRYYETWSRFESRSVRNGAQPHVDSVARFTDYRIETNINLDLSMSVAASGTLTPREAGSRAFAFELSEQLKVTAARIEGQPVEFLQRNQAESSRAAQRSNGLVILVMPHALERGRGYFVEFEYEGQVISDAGSGVYFVGDRGSWYPRTGFEFTNYDLTFRYPPSVELVATGERISESLVDGLAVSRFKTSKLSRVAGFNLGDYAKAVREVGDYRVEVRATTATETRLQQNRSPILMPNPIPQNQRRRFGRRAPSMIMKLPDAPRITPASRIEAVADDSAAAFEFFLHKFGEPAFPTTVISPVPGDFGQGFPGLVYASTLSYFLPGDPPLEKLPASAKQFYTELLRPHELAHQWWGNVVTIDDDSEVWIMEALATYSSLLWVEERKGPKALDAVLAGYKDNLLAKREGGTIESAGAVVLGGRLRTSKTPNAYRVIVYEKGAWIIHMLRGRLGDDAFYQMLRAMRDEFDRRPIRSEDFRKLAARFLPPGSRDPELIAFFDQWVYGTGIPRLSVAFDQAESAGQFRLTARVEQSDVPDHFSVDVPIEVHTIPGRSLTKTVTTGDEDSGFAVTLRNEATRLVIDPAHTLLLATE